MRQTPQEQPESMEFPRREFESVCFHAIGLVDQNREYLQMHLRESGDAPTRQALADMELQTARLERWKRARCRPAAVLICAVFCGRQRPCGRKWPGRQKCT